MKAVTPSQRSRFWPATITLLVLAAAGWGAWHYFHPAEKPAARVPQVQVSTVPVKTQSVPIFQTGVGTVTARQTVTVKARVDGQLIRIGFAEGQDVKAGQVLAELDPRVLQAQLQQAQAQRTKDQATLDNARTDLRRITTLREQDAATQQQFDTQKSLVAQLDAATKTDDALVNSAQVQLGFTTITAPIAGRVGARLVDVGNIVHAADVGGIVVINQIDPITAVFTIPEDAFGQVNRAMQAAPQDISIQAFAREGNELLGTGKLLLLNNQIDTTNGTVQLKAIFDNPKHTLWPGEYINVRLVLGQRADALTVPSAAVLRSQDGTYAYVIDADNKARNQPIKVARIQDGIAIIDDGLKAGDRVVVDGQYKLRPGAVAVEAKAPGTAPAGGAKAPAPDAPAAPAGAGASN
ncbi:MAG: efflux RND transporter periplasmic adaptor subunit [Pseudomonadota bacterium]